MRAGTARGVTSRHPGECPATRTAAACPRHIRGAVIDTRTSGDAPPAARPADGPEAPVPHDPAGAAAPDELGRELARLIRLNAAAKARGRYDTGPVPDGGDRLLLAYLVLEGPRRVTDLAAMTYLDVSTVSRQVASLVQRGLVERRPDPKDGRGTMLAATAEGDAAFEMYRLRRQAHLDRVTRRWSDAERRTFITLLGRFNDDLELEQTSHGREAPQSGAEGHPA